MLSLAITSIFGTLIPQNQSHVAYLKEYGRVLYRFFSILDIFDMYHSWWFQLLLLLLTINVIVCSLDRFPAIWKIISVKIPPFNVSRFRHLKHKVQFTDNRSVERLKEIYSPIISRSFGYSRVENTEKGICIFAEKWRWTRLGVYIIHFSVVLLLFGGLIGSIFGFDGFVNIPEGEVAKSIRLRNSGEIRKLDFEIRCDDFNVSFYDSGMPKEYRSSLSILNHGKVVVKKDIVVNKPLRYKGINLFQASYGTLPPNKVTLDFTSKKTGKVYRKKAVVGQPVDIPEGLGTFTVRAYKNSAQHRGNDIGQAITGTLMTKNGSPVSLVLPIRFPNFDKMRDGDVIIAFAGNSPRYYTGLSVTRDPGVWIVYAGFILMIIGFIISTFMSHQRLCIEVIKKGEKSDVVVTGTTNRNKMGMDRKIKKISKKLYLMDKE